MIRRRNDEQKRLRQPFDSPIELGLSLCLQQKLLKGGGVGRKSYQVVHFPACFLASNGCHYLFRRTGTARPKLGDGGGWSGAGHSAQYQVKMAGLQEKRYDQIYRRDRSGNHKHALHCIRRRRESCGLRAEGTSGRFIRSRDGWNTMLKKSGRALRK